MYEQTVLYQICTKSLDTLLLPDILYLDPYSDLHYFISHHVANIFTRYCQESHCHRKRVRVRTPIHNIIVSAVAINANAFGYFVVSYRMLSPFIL